MQYFPNKLNVYEQKLRLIYVFQRIYWHILISLKQCVKLTCELNWTCTVPREELYCKQASTPRTWDASLEKSFQALRNAFGSFVCQRVFWWSWLCAYDSCASCIRVTCIWFEENTHVTLAFMMLVEGTSPRAETSETVAFANSQVRSWWFWNFKGVVS